MFLSCSYSYRNCSCVVFEVRNFFEVSCLALFINVNHTINLLFTDMHNGLLVLNDSLEKDVTDFGATMIDS